MRTTTGSHSPSLDTGVEQRVQLWGSLQSSNTVIFCVLQALLLRQAITSWQQKTEKAIKSPKRWSFLALILQRFFLGAAQLPCFNVETQTTPQLGVPRVVVTFSILQYQMGSAIRAIIRQLLLIEVENFNIRCRGTAQASPYQRRSPD